MKTGVVISYRDDRGFGFVTADGELGEIFFRRSDITHRGAKTVDPSERVTFDMVPDERKPGKMKAANVARVQPAVDFDAMRGAISA